ncbi:T9SS type A sorting domain-containing protein [Mucilaginibacter sp. BJC16-A38]|uniref:T9SS type A sorting domain-containing protein n=1 Tax=Mucilaginibacter phenanthrenivorans TaxID=1234842 RepID=UPI0021586F67|nr:T9SS type A sorting domain-containing protein [Mucilaginibacter phenanthrenivorans]MCR8557670.1 T9SS type A sorting domain-containing protein [Mucilaginibacter phenanthrenivorans]
MKKLLVKPGFELIFSVSFMAILCLPPMLLAQNKIKKDMDIQILNGDTTVNGKNIKQLSAADRQDALTDINNLHNPAKGKVFFFKHIDTTGGKINHVEIRRRDGRNDQVSIAENFVFRDSLGNAVERRPRVMARRWEIRGDNNDGGPGMGRGADRRTMGPMARFDRKNSQNFEYVNTDNDGVATRVSFHVSEASDDDLKRMPYVEGPKFEIKDLNLVPQFSSGKVLLMFNLLSKTPAEVKLSDSEGKFLWSEKAVNGTFSKSFALGLNGIYYLQIKQGKSISLKKIMKEE